MAALQRLELGQPILQLGQALRITLQTSTVPIQVTGQFQQLRQHITATGREFGSCGIKLLHLQQFSLANRQVIQH